MHALLFYDSRMLHFASIRTAMRKSPSSEPGSIFKRHTMHVPRYKVLLHNDDVNTMDHVLRALERVFRFDPATCTRIMLEAHSKGVAVCTVEPLERAELHRDQLTSFSLIATIEPE